MRTTKTLAFLLALTLSSTIMAQHNFFINSGYGRRLSDSPNELFTNQLNNKNHRNTVKNGMDLTFAYDYTLKPFLAIGVKTSMFGSFDSYNDSQSGLVNADDEYIFYVGPSARYIFKPIDKWTISARGTIGLMHLQNSQKAAIYNTNTNKYSSNTTTYSGNCFGWGIDGLVDYNINEWLSINGSLGFMGGSVGKLKAVDESFKLNNNENLSRIDLTVGISIKL